MTGLAPAGMTRDRLMRTVTWRSSVLLAIGAGLQVTVIMGAMAGELGNIHVLVWASAAFIGLVQCYLIAELAMYEPDRAGGVATYAREAFGQRAPWLAGMSGWGYWFAWTPGIAVNLILAAEYLGATILPGVDTVTLGLVMGAALYILNALGLRHLMRVATVLMLLAGVTLLALLAAPAVQSSLFSAGELWPLRLPESPDASAASSTAELFIKWFFVATWSAYGAELAASIVAEVRDKVAGVPRTMVVAGVVCLVAFTMVPLVMTGIVGADGLSESPATVFLAPAEAVFGTGGRIVVGVMLAAALLLGAQAYIVASSRTVYQLSRDAYLPRLFTQVNRYGVPVMSVIFDALVIGALLLIFGTDVVNIVAAANIGYLVVFVLMPLTFVLVRRQRLRLGEPVVLSRPWTAVGAAIFALNAVLLVVGAALWGPAVWFTGAVIMVLILPLMALRRWRDAARRGRTARVGEAAEAGRAGVEAGVGL